MTTLEYNQATLDAQIAPTAAADEWWDTHVNRPLAATLVRAVEKTAITPNQITVLSGITGVGSAICFGLAHGYWPLLGGLLLLTTLILDCADGQLARLRGGGTFIGRMMDGYVDWITAVAIHFGLWAYFATIGFDFFGRTVSGAWATFVVALSAGVTMALHSMIYDHYKNRFRRLTGTGSSEVHSPTEISERIRRAESAGERFYLRVYWLYCKSQASVASEEGGSGVEAVDPKVAAVRAHYLNRGVRVWSGVGPTMRLTVFAFSAILAAYFAWGFYLYLLFAVVFTNLYALVAAQKVKRIESEMEAELKSLA